MALPTNGTWRWIVGAFALPALGFAVAVGYQNAQMDNAIIRIEKNEAVTSKVDVMQKQIDYIEEAVKEIRQKLNER